MCTLWLIESLARAGAYKPEILAQSVAMLEDYMGQYSFSFKRPIWNARTNSSELTQDMQIISAC